MICEDEEGPGKKESRWIRINHKQSPLYSSGTTPELHEAFNQITYPIPLFPEISDVPFSASGMNMRNISDVPFSDPSEPGQGCRFTIELPATLPQDNSKTMTVLEEGRGEKGEG